MNRSRKISSTREGTGWRKTTTERLVSVVVARWPRSSVGQDAPLARVKPRFDPGRGLQPDRGQTVWRWIVGIPDNPRTTL